MKEDGSAILTRLALLVHTQKLLCQLLGKTSAITALGVGRPGAPAPEQGVEGERGPGPGSSIRPGSVPGPRPVLSRLGNPGALTQAEPSTPRAQAPTDGEGGGNTQSARRKWAGLGVGSPGL